MSKILKRALKNTIIPAITMIAGKSLGVFVVSAIYGFSLQIGNDINGIFSTQIYFQDREVTQFVNSISDLIMLLSLAVPTMYLIIKTAIFQSASNNPKTIVKVAEFNMLKWITKDDTSFLKIFIWCAFLWIASALVIRNGIQNDTYSWIAILAGGISFITGLGALKTFEVETNKVYPDSKKYY
ncbi:hypothetical protein A2436_01905 [candidate division WS6 bacterium RIFOXYC1_FULL_33_9]|nr:MAG: hypothetical protein A2436_01905 [candidate division WS6 bacterium RIFOXYC1_FULL_33_9]